MSAFAGLAPPPVLWLAVSVFGSKIFRISRNDFRNGSITSGIGDAIKTNPARRKESSGHEHDLKIARQKTIYFIRTPAKRKLTTLDHSVTSESLEQRQVMSVTNPWFSGSMLVVPTDNNSTNVELTSSGSNLVVRDHSSNRSWTYSASQVSRVEFQGGNETIDSSITFTQCRCEHSEELGTTISKGTTATTRSWVVQATTRWLATVVMISYGVALEMTCCLGEMAMMISWLCRERSAERSGRH